LTIVLVERNAAALASADEDMRSTGRLVLRRSASEFANDRWITEPYLGSAIS
jgi:hypothetical protein